MRRHLILGAALAVVAAACGGGTASSSTTTSGSTTSGATTSSSTATTAATTTTAAATTTTEAESGDALTANDDGSYTINWDALSGTVFFAPAGGGDDPFFHVHTDPAADGFFFSVEAFTTGFGEAWTGELGDFEVGCATQASSGICVYFDPDGRGPLGVLGADGMTSGDVTIVQADGEGFVAIFSNLEFSDGTTIPGPFTVTG